jgi:hypothetical protein
MCYINTLLVQNVLSDPKWFAVLTKEDLRALSPLFHAHINPYGLVALNMNRRINVSVWPSAFYAPLKKGVKFR